MAMRILYFSRAAELAGYREETWACTKPLSVEAFWQDLLARHPQLTPLRSACRLAVNQTYATSETMIPPDAEVALIPPVSGG